MFQFAEHSFEHMRQSNLLPLAVADCKKAPSNASAYDPSPNDFKNVGCAAPRSAVEEVWFEAGFDDDNLTDAKCSTTCVDYAYFGIRYGRDCWCGNTLPVVTGNQDDCTYPNSGASNEIGGSDTAFSIFQQNPAVETGPGGSTNTTDGFYLGCLSAQSNENPPRDLFTTYDHTPAESNATTQESCLLECAAFKYFALQNGNTCRCDNSIPFGNIVYLDDEACDVRAAGNSAEAGGGDTELTAFYNPNYVVRPGLLSQCSKLCSANMKTYNPG